VLLFQLYLFGVIEKMPVCNCCSKTNWELSFISPDRMYPASDEYHVYICVHCGIYRLETSYDPDVIAGYYPKNSYYSYKGDDPLQKFKVLLYKFLFSGNPASRFFGFPLRQLMRGIQIRSTEKVLDIGCGGGKFLAVIKALDMEPFGIEINPESKVACESVTDQILIVPFENIDAAETFSNCPEMKFDQVVSNHVIEHSTNPLNFLIGVKKHLKVDGVATISTPNPNSFYARIFKNYWAQLDCPRHLYLISPEVMTRYCEQTGLRIERVRHLSDQFGIVGSTLYLIEQYSNFSFSQRAKGLVESVGKIILLPVYTIVNLLGAGDTVEYTLRHR
jgi:2-polyprenyl-3-methyl-5-hydroxy-6-metoxy-1,4-benzoquinol methylase